MLRILIQAGAIIGLLIGTASAQFAPTFHLGEQRQMTPEEIEKQKAIDKAYNSANKKIPDKKTVDPWGSVRPIPPTASQNK
jgi:hypothetical protein